ncbi:MAG TPA: hypothetical protein VFS94_04075 [Gemmatimonadales bacterium]|nr:hypothetical protein [Gemmatimonadales bacterium]
MIAAVIALAGCDAGSTTIRAEWPDAVTAGKPIAFPLGFDRISSYVATSDSTGLVADATSRRLVLVDWTDGTLTDLVRDGAGPGEVGGLSALVAVPGGAAMLDHRQRQLMHFRSDGSVAEELRMDSLPLGVELRGADQAGRYYFEWRGIRRAAVPDSAYLLRWQPGSGADTIGRVLSPPMRSIELVRGTSRNTMLFAVPYAAQDLWAAAPDGRLAALRGSGPRLELVSASGSSELGPVLAVPPGALSQADRDSARIPEELRQDLQWPDVLPPFTGQLSWCQDSELLIAPVSTSIGSAPSILLLKSTGEPLAVMRLELGERMVGCSRGLLFTAVTDQQELERLRRRRLPEVDEN